MSSKRKFTPIKGTEEAIMNKMPDYHDGYVYFATDTKKIYLDADGHKKIPMGTSSSGFYYGIKETTDEEDETNIITFTLKEIEGDHLPNPDDLVFNSPDSCFYRVVTVDFELNTFRGLRLTVAGSGGGGGGSDVKDDINVSIIPLKDDTFIFGQEQYISVIPMAKINKLGHPVDTYLTLTWKVATSDGQQFTTGTQIVKHGEKVEFEFGTKMYPNQYNTISFSLEGPNSGAMRKPNSITYSCVKMSLKTHNDFSNLTLYNTDFNMVCTVEGKIDKILEWYFDGSLVKKDLLNKETEGRVTCPFHGAKHGSHKIKIRLFQSLSGDYGTEVTPLEFEIACKDGSSTIPIIWVGDYKKTYYNYERISIPFLVYNPKSDNSIVRFYKDGNELNNSPKTVTYSTKTTTHFELFDIIDATENEPNYYTITSGEAPPKEITFTVVQDETRKMELAAAKSNLLLNFNSAGRSNNESNVTRDVWTYKNKNLGENAPLYKGVFKNFNWYNNGWIADENYNTCLRISNGASFDIPIGIPYGQKVNTGITFNGTTQGEQSQVFEFEFKIRNVQNYEHLIRLVTRYKDDSLYYEKYTNPELDFRKKYESYDQFLQYYLPTIGKNYEDLEYDKVQSVISTDSALCNFYDEKSKVGFCLGTQDAFFSTGENTLTVNYVENRIINLTLVFSKSEQLISIYLNGVLSGAAKNTKTNTSFIIAKEFMTLNSEFCDIDLYKFRMYDTAFSISEVLNNYAVDTRDVLMFDESTKLSKWNADINEFQLDYDSMITFNDEHPDNYLMPYLLFDEVPGDILPYSKKYKTTANVRFVNTGLDRAFVTGEIDDLCKSYPTGEVFQGYFALGDITPYIENSVENGVYVATLLDGTQKRFNNPDNTLKTVSRKFKNKKKDLIPVWRKLTKKENYYLHHGASFSGTQIPYQTQGTSSQFYPRRNYKIKCKEKMFADNGPFKNDHIHMPFFFMDNDHVGTTKFTLKVDYMESSGTYNTGFVNMVHNAYTKHPLNDYEKTIDGMPNLQGHRTNVGGFPALAFHHKTSDNSTTFIGRYNMNLDKGSDEVYGFKLYKDNNTFGDKATSILVGGNDVSDVAECWEFSDNNRGYCSFRDPLQRDELSFVITPEDIENAGQVPTEDERKKGYRTNAKGSCLQVADSFEYRYHCDEDMLDYLYDPTSFSEDDRKELIDDYDLVETPGLVDDYAWRQEFLQGKMSNWEKACKWVWSTCTDQVKGEEELFNVYAATNHKYYLGPTFKYNKELGKKEDALIFNTSNKKESIKVTKTEAETYLKTTLGYTDEELLAKWGVEVSTLTPEGETEVKKQITNDSIFQAYADNKGYIYISYTSEGKVFTATFEGGEILLRSDVVVDINTNSDGKYDIELASRQIKKLLEPYTVANSTYYFDTKEYRLAKFKNEFDKHFDREYSFKYFIMTEVFMCYDSRGKNAMFASWGPHEEGGDYIWYPLFYDLDTQLGINNTGIPSFEYFVNASKDGCYSTNDSVLWGNIFQCFLEELRATYQALRTNIINKNDPSKANRAPLAGVEYFGQDPVEHIEHWYTCNPITCKSICMRGHRPLLAINFDEYYKYISIMNQDGPGYQGTEGKPIYDTGTFLYALQGDRGLSRQQFLMRRINFIDSWLTQGNYAEGSGSIIKFRTSANDPKTTSDKWIDSPSNVNSSGEVISELITNAGYYKENENGEIEKDIFGDPVKKNLLDADFFVKLSPFQRSYVTLATDNAPLPSIEYNGTPVRLDFPANVVAGVRSSPQYAEQLLYVYGADYLKDIGDVSLLYPREFLLKGATHLQKIILGSDEEGYFNNKLKSPQFDAGINESGTGGKPLLKEVVFTGVRTDDDVNVTLDFQSSEKLQIFRALKMNLAGVKFADGVALHTLHLPNTITSLALREARNLEGLITQYVTPTKNESNEWVAQKGLYIPGLTDQEGSLMSSDITHFEIVGGKMGYDSYTLLEKLYTIKEKNSGELAITLKNVNWTPYSKLEKGYIYKEDESSKYYIDNGHYQLVPYNTFEIKDSFQYDEKIWKDRIKNGLVYIKNTDLEPQVVKIKNLNLLNSIAGIRDDKGSLISTKGTYKSTAQTNNEVPIIDGNIYIDNEDPIDESWIKNVLLAKEIYPNLHIFVKNVTKAYSAKFMKVNDNDGSLEVIGTQKISIKESTSKTFFDSPYELYAELTHKDNYDFYGWSTAPNDAEKVIPLETWSQQSFVPDQFEYNYYIVYKKHPYRYHFYNTDGTNVLQGIEEYLHDGDYYITVEYNNSMTEAVPNIVPSSPDEASLPDMRTCLKFSGWTIDREKMVPFDFSATKSIKDLDFYPIYKEHNVHDKESVLDDSYLQFDEIGRYLAVSVKPGIKLSGKITLPVNHNGRPINMLKENAFSGNEGITHIFWDNKFSPSIEVIGARACDSCTNLQYFEMPSSVTELQSYVFYNCGKLMNNSISQELKDEFFLNLNKIGGYCFMNTGITGTVHFGAKLHTLESYAMGASGGITEIVFGYPDAASKLEYPGNDIFFNSSGINSLTYYINANDADKWNNEVSGFIVRKFSFDNYETMTISPVFVN